MLTFLLTILRCTHRHEGCEPGFIRRLFRHTSLTIPVPVHCLDTLRLLDEIKLVSIRFVLPCTSFDIRYSTLIRSLRLYSTKMSDIYSYTVSGPHFPRSLHSALSCSTYNVRADERD